ncbi:hypothetical protein L7F22_038474 [Adiantum nelumboides]|nr:hypothetical protein [Adiantum nelumboides]
MGRSKRIEWQYVEKIKALRKAQWTCKCNFCGHVWGGGPHRIRSHLLSLPGQGVGPCDSVTEDVKDIVRRLHADASSDGKDSREAIDALVDDLGGSASQSQGDASFSTHGEGSTHASGSSKSNVNSSKKRKVAQGAGGLPAAFGLQARKQADQALRRFFYAEDVPEWKVRSPYFLDMIKAIGNVGPSYVPPSYHALRTTELNDEVQCLKKEIMGDTLENEEDDDDEEEQQKGLRDKILVLTMMTRMIHPVSLDHHQGGLPQNQQTPLIPSLAESLFSTHREEYAEMEQASLNQLFQAKMSELRALLPQQGDIQGTINRSRVVASSPSHQPMSTSVVTEFVRWNEEAVQRCCLLTPQPIPLATNVRAIFTCLLDQVSHYTTEGLERAREALNEAAALRERFVIGASVSRRVAAAAASAAEAAAAAGESSFRAFMVAVQRSTTNVAMVQQHFVSTVARLLLPVDGAHAACCEEMAASMSNAEGAALKGLQQCIDTVMVEVDRLLAAEQKVTDYCPPEDGNVPDHRPTNACIRVVAYLARMLEAANGALEGLNKQAFMTEMGNRLHKGLLSHWQRFTFNPSGGLRLKRDATEYAEFVRSFKAPAVDEKFETLGTLVNVFIVAPESLFTLIDGSLRGSRKEALRFIELREDYKSAKIANRVGMLLDEH